MAKKRKRSTRRRTTKKRKQEMPGWAWGALGLAIGLSVAVAIYVKDRRIEPVPKPRPVAAAVEPQPVFDDNDEVGAPEKSGETADGEQRFTFYEMLLKSEIVVRDEEDSSGSIEPVAVVEPGTYALQVGSFSAEQDADRRRAELAFQGIESSIQKASVGGRIYYRVRIGPTNDLDELNLLRSRLRAAEIDALIVREVDD